MPIRSHACMGSNGHVRQNVRYTRTGERGNFSVGLRGRVWCPSFKKTLEVSQYEATMVVVVDISNFKVNT